MLAQTILQRAEYVGSAPTAQDVLSVASGFRALVYGFTITDDTGGTLKLFFSSDAAANRFLHMDAAANGGASIMFPAGCAVQGGDGENVKVTAPGASKVTIFYTLEPVES